MKYPDASKMSSTAGRLDASKPTPGIPQVRTPSPKPKSGSLARIAPHASLAAAAQSGDLPPPASTAAAAGNSPLNVPQAAMVVGEPIPVIWGRRRGTVGGVLVFPWATEARFENNSTTVTSRYHMVICDGRLPDIQRRDVRLGECRIGSFSQNYNQRAGAWTPGNFATAQTGYTVPTFPTFTGGGGNYQGMSTFEAGVTVPGGSDDWRTGWNVFLRGGTIVERGRLLDSAVESSDNIADLVIWALQRSGQVPDAMIDLPSLTAAARFCEANGLWCNGEFGGSTNLGDWLIKLLPDFLLRETKVNGKFGLRPLVPTNANGTINTGAITPSWLLTEKAIKPGSYQAEYSGAAASRPTPLAMLWRQQHDDADVPIVRTLPVGDPNAPGPLEQHDLSQYATTEDHAAKVGVYRFTRRTLSTHTATVVLKPGNQTGLIVEGDIVQLYLQVVSSREPASVISRFYVVETIGHSLSGEETLSLSHLPVNSSGQSLIALAVAAATGTGTILPSNRTGGSCDLPGAAADTSVPSRSTSGSPFNQQGQFTDPYGGAGAPVDAPPDPGASPTSPARRLAQGGGAIPPSSDTRCPYGYNRVAGSFKWNFIDVFANFYSQDISFVATEYPIINYTGQIYPGWGAAAGRTWDEYVITWTDPVNGPQSGTSYEIPATPMSGGGTYVGRFSLTANSYSCDLFGPSGTTTPGPTVSGRFYKVVEGDSMSGISEKMYGTASRANDIRTANPGLMGLDNWGLWPGLILTIPN